MNDESIFKAIHENNLLKIQDCLDNGININITDNDGNTPICYAIDTSNEDIVKYLIEKKANICNNKSGNTVMHHAACSNRISIIKYCIQNQIDINIRNEKGVTPLIYSIIRNHIDTVQVIVENGGDLNQPDNDEWTPLMFAVRYERIEIVDKLIKSGADINKTDKNGWSALLTAVEREYIVLSKYLIDHADVNAQDFERTAFMIACNNGNTFIAKYLIDHGAKLDETNMQGETALKMALSKNYTDIAKYLIENNANLNISVHNILRIAIRNQNMLLVQMLVERGIDVNKTDRYGQTPLLFALDHKYNEIASYLIKHDADIHKPSACNWSTLHYSVRTNNDAITKYLLQHNVDINIMNNRGETPLHLAAECGYFKIAMYLVKNGAKINMADCYGNTALHFAAKSAKYDIARYLIDSKADIDKINLYGETSLHKSVFVSYNITKYLIEHEAVHLPNKNGETPLFIALKGVRSHDIIQLLLYSINMSVNEIFRLYKRCNAEHVYSNAWIREIKQKEDNQLKVLVKDTMIKRDIKRYFTFCELFSIGTYPVDENSRVNINQEVNSEMIGYDPPVNEDEVRPFPLMFDSNLNSSSFDATLVGEIFEFARDSLEGELITNYK